ncbi:SLBB domain-containing protein [Roseateles sp.]|uniref:SLBB domain-containing protein n=1 Tax=Roseateles sp. TaxID=1971397 RepID=UPI0039337BAE
MAGLLITGLSLAASTTGSNGNSELETRGSASSNNSNEMPGSYRLENTRKDGEADRERPSRNRADERGRSTGREGDKNRDRRDDPRDRLGLLPLVPYQPGEFEQYVQGLVDNRDVVIERFGARLIAGESAAPVDSEFGPLVPPDYIVGPGDELRIALWGSVDGDLRATVDRSGRVQLPRIGAVMVSGLRFDELNAALSARIAQVFKQFKVSASIDRMRTMRVYVTGYAQRPGAYAVPGSASLINAVLMSGGPTAAGSFRRIELRRPGAAPVVFDLYDLLVKGDRSADRLLQPEDVIHFTPVGEQVGLIGSVNSPAVFELKPGETVADLLLMGGGFAAVADRSRLLIERLSQRSEQRVVELALPAQGSAGLRAGDVVRAVSALTNAQPQQRQNKRVRVEGEVLRPGEYILPPGSTLADALAAAGGLTPGAFVFGTEFTRESVRQQQEQSFERTMRDFENDLARAASTQRASSPEEATVLAGRQINTNKLVDRIRTLRPTGRIVLQLAPTASALPALSLEDGDKLVIPARPTTVGVFGAVYNAGSFVFGQGGALQSFLAQAGGPNRGADAANTFVVRANGSVVSANQNSGWIVGRSALSNVQAEPGDLIFVPEELNKSTFVQNARDWTQIFYQFGLGAAGLKALKN